MIRKPQPRSLTLVLGLVAAAAIALSAAADASARWIVGGSPARIADWPFLVALASSDEEDGYAAQFCGGSIVAPTVVVTAAHCLQPDMDVIAGRTLLSTGEGERIPVVAQHTPPGYDAATNVPDLAVLILARPVQSPAVALASSQDAALLAPGTAVASAGWGVIAQQPRETFSEELRSVNVVIAAGRDCARVYDGWSDAQMLCTRPVARLNDTCQGDSGGPLVLGAGAQAKLVGVVSFGGDTCGDPKQPGAYAQVIPHHDWIMQFVSSPDAAAAQPAVVDLPVAEARTIRLKIAKARCETPTRCSVDVKATGPADRLGGGILVVADRRGRRPVERKAFARQVRPGLWRAWLNIPYGDVRVTAVGLDTAGNRVTRPGRAWYEVT